MKKLVGILLILASFAILGTIFLLETQEKDVAVAADHVTAPTAVPHPEPEESAPHTLSSAYQAAWESTQEEGDDLRLLGASTQWQQASEEAILKEAGNWVFTFYAPSKREEIDVLVKPQGARIVNRSRVYKVRDGLSDGQWQEGPRDALLIFLAQGGREFLTHHPTATVNVHLSSNQSQAVWTILATDIGAESLSVQVEATTNRFLSVTG